MDFLGYINREYLGQEFFGVTTYDWLLLGVVWVLAAAGLILLHRFLKWRFEAFAKRTANDLDDLVARLLKQTRLYFLVALGLYIALQFAELTPRAEAWLQRGIFVLLLFQVIRWGDTLISVYLDRYKARKLETDAAAVTTMQAIGFLGRLLLWAVVILLALDNFGVDITALVAGLGIGGVAVALALQNILGDLFASLSIVLDKPFVVGDFLIVGDFLGTVEHIGLKTTRIRSLSGEQIVFSNSDLLGSRIRNYKRMYERRIVFSLGVVYQTPHDKLAAISGILREIIEAQDRVRFDRAHFKGYGDFSLNFEIVYYVLVPDYNVYMDIQQAINLAIFERFEEEGIDFAYPTQRLFVTPSGEVPEAVGDDRAG